MNQRTAGFYQSDAGISKSILRLGAIVQIQKDAIKEDLWLQLCQKNHFLQKKVTTLSSLEFVQFILRISEVLGSHIEKGRGGEREMRRKNK
jgi:hypothetical protein